MNFHFVSTNSKVCFLFCTFSSIWLVSCGMRTAPVFIPEQKEKQTITDLKVQQRDNRVRLSWRINQTERINRLKKLDLEFGKGDYFLIHQKLIKFDCEECESRELTDLKVMIPSGSVIQDGNKIFYYLQFPEKSLDIHSYQISHYGIDGEIFSYSKKAQFIFKKASLCTGST